ncbi:MAG: hypothetical protein U0V56_01635 [Actinomycetota bacterium]
MARVLVAGLGDIGLEIVKTAGLHPDADIVGAVDIDPERARAGLGALSGLAELSDVPVDTELGNCLSETRPDVVVLSTSSRFEPVARDTITCFEAGASVITTCEEMTYPYGRAGADALADVALRTRKAVVGVGVNPGFVMDYLPAFLSLASRKIEQVTIDRKVDLNRRRPALRKKAGVGLLEGEFRELASAGSIGHVGLDASARLLADALGFSFEWPSVDIDPILASNDRAVVGFHQRTGWEATVSSPGIALHLEMSTELESEYDRITIVGSPSFEAVVEGGIAGDVATAAIVVNAIPRLLETTPGVKTVLDLRAPRAWLPGT